MRLARFLVMALAAAVIVSLSPRPGFASVETTPSFEQFAQAWMGAVAREARADRGEARRSLGRRTAGRLAWPVAPGRRPAARDARAGAADDGGEDEGGSRAHERG